MVSLYLFVCVSLNIFYEYHVFVIVETVPNRTSASIQTCCRETRRHLLLRPRVHSQNSQRCNGEHVLMNAFRYSCQRRCDGLSCVLCVCWDRFSRHSSQCKRSPALQRLQFCSSSLSGGRKKRPASQHSPLSAGKSLVYLFVYQ